MPESGTRPPWSHRALGGIVWFVFWGLRWLPRHASYALAELGALVYLIVIASTLRDWRRRSRGFHRNVQIVYRDRLTPRLKRWLLFAYCRHMARMAVDFCRLPRITEKNLHRYVEFDGLEDALAVYREAGRAIFITGHVGIPDLCGHVGALLGLPFTGVFQPTPWQPVTDVVSALRSAGGQRVLAKAGAMWSLKKSLDRGECIGFAADASAKHIGVFAPFLGTLAETNPTAALLHRHTRVPIIVGTCTRVGLARYQLDVRRIVRFEPTADKDADLLAISSEINGAIEQSIVESPEQWFWHCRRFRWRPPGEVPGPDGLPPPAEGVEPVPLPARFR